MIDEKKNFLTAQLTASWQASHTFITLLYSVMVPPPDENI